MCVNKDTMNDKIQPSINLTAQTHSQMYVGLGA